MVADSSANWRRGPIIELHAGNLCFMSDGAVQCHLQQGNSDMSPPAIGEQDLDDLFTCSMQVGWCSATSLQQGISDMSPPAVGEQARWLA
ncbi:hypothetical protein V6N13_019700 [Hibiscus sabdariffa]